MNISFSTDLEEVVDKTVECVKNVNNALIDTYAYFCKAHWSEDVKYDLSKHMRSLVNGILELEDTYKLGDSNDKSILGIARKWHTGSVCENRAEDLQKRFVSEAVSITSQLDFAQVGTGAENVYPCKIVCGGIFNLLEIEMSEYLTMMEEAIGLNEVVRGVGYFMTRYIRLVNDYIAEVTVTLNNHYSTTQDGEGIVQEIQSGSEVETVGSELSTTGEIISKLQSNSVIEWFDPRVKLPSVNIIVRVETTDGPETFDFVNEPLDKETPFQHYLVKRWRYATREELIEIVKSVSRH